MSHDVPDHQRDRPVRQGQRVERVAPGRGVLLGRQVTAGDLHSRQDGQVVRSRASCSAVTTSRAWAYSRSASARPASAASWRLSRSPASTPVVITPRIVPSSRSQGTASTSMTSSSVVPSVWLYCTRRPRTLTVSPVRRTCSTWVTSRWQQFRGHLPQGAAHGIGPPDRLRARRVQRGDDQSRPSRQRANTGNCAKTEAAVSASCTGGMGWCTRLPPSSGRVWMLSSLTVGPRTRRPRRPNGCVSSRTFPCAPPRIGQGSSLDGREVALAGHALCGCRRACGLTGRIPAAG